MINRKRERVGDKEQALLVLANVQVKIEALFWGIGKKREFLRISLKGFVFSEICLGVFTLPFSGAVLLSDLVLCATIVELSTQHIVCQRYFRFVSVLVRYKLAYTTSTHSFAAVKRCRLLLKG